MTVDEIADYCEFTDCQVAVGSPETGFIEIDGTGLTRKFNYQRFLKHRELNGLASPRQVVAGATVFKVQRAQTQVMNRQEFEAELRRFQAIVA